MDAVGTNVGSVHRQRQGTGLATVLQGDQAVDTYSRIWQVDQVKQARLDAERAAKRGAAMQAIKSYSPERWFRHEKELDTALNAHFAKGSELLARGVDDPFSSTLPEAQDWQMERARLTAMASASKQLQSNYETLQAQVLKADPDAFDARSLDNAVKFYDQPLSQILDSGAVPPTLQRKRPYLDTMKFMADRMSGLQSATGAAPTEDELRQFTKGLISDPANQQQLVEGYGSRLAQASPEEKKALEERALAAGVQPVEQMMYEDGLRYQKAKTPLNLQQEIKQAADMATAGIDYSDWGTAEATGKTPKGKKEAIAAAVEATFNSDLRYMEVFNKEGMVPRGAEMSDREYATEVKAYMASLIEPLVKTTTEYKKTEKGAADTASVKGRNAFIEDMRSGDWRRIQGAANVLVGTRWANNLDIQDATVTQGPQGFRLELDLGTNVSLKDVKDQITDPNTGISSEQVSVEDRQGRRIATIDLAEGAISNQTLARIIDNTMKATGKPYDPSLTERSPQTAMEAAGAVVPGAPAPKQSTTDANFWK